MVEERQPLAFQKSFIALIAAAILLIALLPILWGRGDVTTVLHGYEPSLTGKSNDLNTDTYIHEAVSIDASVNTSRFDILKGSGVEGISCSSAAANISQGPPSICSKNYGWDMISTWLNNHALVISGVSEVICAVNEDNYSFCKFSNVTIDFSHSKPHGLVRRFTEGFFTTYGKKLIKRFAFDIPFIQHKEDEDLENDWNNSFRGGLEYDFFETRPAFIISHDDIFNLGHHMNDIMNVWHMSVMARRNMKQSVLINFDGLRTNGPAGGPPHRLMVPSSPDTHGPYIDYYNSWFQEVKMAMDYKSERVRFAELYVPSNPYYPWFWNSWRTENECALKESSPLYQSFNLFLRNRWSEMYGDSSLPLPDTDNVHIVLEVRPIDPKKKDEHSSARHIENVLDLVDEMKRLPNVRVTAQDFTLLPFSEQVALSHSAGVFVSMHGAGTTHIFHSAVGAPNCCALVELQPEKRLGYEETKGYANLARMHGLHYYRYAASDGRTSPSGTTVDIGMVMALIQQAVSAVGSTPSCLGDVRDTRETSLLGFRPL